MTDKKNKLTPMQMLFVSKYVKLGVGYLAAKEAGYKGNDDTLRVTASRLLTNANVIRELEKRQEKRNERLELEEDFEAKMSHKILMTALEDHDLRNANTAVKTLAQIRGKLVQKVQVDFATGLAEELGLKNDSDD